MSRDRYSLVMGRVLVALAVGLAFSAILPLSCRGQSRASVLPLGALTLGYVGGTIDHDPGQYRDSFRFLPDKQAHALASLVLAKAVADGTSVRLGAATCVLAGLAWEAGQSRHHGYASPFDVAYDVTGCVIGARWGKK